MPTWRKVCPTLVSISIWIQFRFLEDREKSILSFHLKSSSTVYCKANFPICQNLRKMIRIHFLEFWNRVWTLTACCNVYYYGFTLRVVHWLFTPTMGRHRSSSRRNLPFGFIILRCWNLFILLRALRFLVWHTDGWSNSTVFFFTSRVPSLLLLVSMQFLDFFD